MIKDCFERDASLAQPKAIQDSISRGFYALKRLNDAAHQIKETVRIAADDEEYDPEEEYEYDEDDDGEDYIYYGEHDDALLEYFPDGMLPLQVMVFEAEDEDEDEDELQAMGANEAGDEVELCLDVEEDYEWQDTIHDWICENWSWLDPHVAPEDAAAARRQLMGGDDAVEWILPALELPLTARLANGGDSNYTRAAPQTHSFSRDSAIHPDRVHPSTLRSDALIASARIPPHSLPPPPGDVT